MLALELLDSSKEAAADLLDEGQCGCFGLAPSHAAVEAASASTDYEVLSVLKSPRSSTVGQS